MSVVLTGVAVGLALIGVSLPFVLSLLPWLGLRPIHRVRPIRLSFLLAAIGVAVGASLLEPSMVATYAVVGVVLAAAVSPLVTFGNVLVALDDPPERGTDGAVLDDADLVIGFESDGTAKAWPFETLLRHNVVNDRLGDRPVLAVFCGLCRLGVVYDPVVDGRRLTFEVANSWRRNMVLRDRQTRTLWQQSTGEALVGELAGSRLEPLGGELVRWGTWRAEHPRSAVSVEPGGVRTRLAKVMNEVVATRLVWPGRGPVDRRLPAKAVVAGIEVGGAARAYPLSILARERLVNDTVGGVPIEVLYDADADRIRAFRLDGGGEPVTLDRSGSNVASTGGDRAWDLIGDPVDGSSRLEPLPVSREWWFAWAEFHPETEIYRAEVGFLTA